MRDNTLKMGNVPDMPNTLMQMTEDVKYTARRVNSQAEQLVTLLYGENLPEGLSAKEAHSSVYYNNQTALDTMADTERTLQSLIERIRGL